MITHSQSVRALVLLCLLCQPVLAFAAGNLDKPVIILPRHRLLAEEIAVIVNDADPLSVRIANYYLHARNIPQRNLVHVNFKPGARVLTPEMFAPIHEHMESQLNDSIQALALTWALPYRVGCMSITAAFTFGFDKKAYCSSKTCASTRHSLYYNSTSTTPFSTHKLRPTMAIAARDFKTAKQLIDRGIESDQSKPKGTAYLVSSRDKNRNVRSVFYQNIMQLFSGLLKVNIEKSNGIKNHHDVMFYFTGIKKVPDLDTLTFLPGAIADHLTSAGGVLDGTSQMSALRWLEAGATGSYGTVIEPCNLLGKFPNPGILLEHYTRGQTLIEAYWKSVQQPGEGLFIGEPLAAPFDGVQIEETIDNIILKTHLLRPGIYRVLAAPGPVGPYQIQAEPLIVRRGQTTMKLPRTKHDYYKIDAVNRYINNSGRAQ